MVVLEESDPTLPRVPIGEGRTATASRSSGCCSRGSTMGSNVRAMANSASYLTDAEFSVKCPKVENHVHLDGSWDLHYLLYLCARFADALPEEKEPLMLPGRKIRVREVALVCREKLLGVLKCDPSIDSSSKTDDELLDLLNDYHVIVDKLADNVDFQKIVSDFRKNVELDKAKQPPTLWEFLSPFAFFMPVVQVGYSLGGKHVLEEFAYRFVRRQKESNVLFAEVRYNPHLILSDEDQKDDNPKRLEQAQKLVETVARGLQRGEKDFGVVVVQILCCLCYVPGFSPDLVQIMRNSTEGKLDISTDRMSGKLVSLDIAAGEEHFVNPVIGTPHKQAVNICYGDLGFRICLHAGEATGGQGEFICKAVEEYGAERIGHGYLIFENDEKNTEEWLTKRIPAALHKDGRRKNVHFECCPSSSLYTGGFDLKQGWKVHPLARLHRRGVSCGINTDDPSVIGNTLHEEYLLCMKEMGLTRKEMGEITLKQLESCFLNPDPSTKEGKLKDRLRMEITDFYQKIDA